jgi:hypothetical protein
MNEFSNNLNYFMKIICEEEENLEKYNVIQFNSYNFFIQICNNFIINNVGFEILRHYLCTIYFFSYAFFAYNL